MRNRYTIDGDVVRIELQRRDGERAETLIDVDDLEKVASLPGAWTILVLPEGYRYVKMAWREDGEFHHVYLHRHIMDAPDSAIVDHINHDTFDNRKVNLRLTSKSGNGQNRRGAQANNSTSRYRGVSWHAPTGKWRARIFVDGREKHLGLFDSEEEAARIAEVARKHYMPFSREAIGEWAS